MPKWCDRQEHALPQVFFQDGIRVAIVGTGWGVKVQVPQFRAAGINIFAICSREQKKWVPCSAFEF